MSTSLDAKEERRIATFANVRAEKPEDTIENLNLGRISETAKGIFVDKII
jgi:hypothetical protein